MVYIDDTSPGGQSVPVPSITSGSKDALGSVEPVPNQPLSFRLQADGRQISLIPLYKLFGERYAVYWKVQRSETG